MQDLLSQSSQELIPNLSTQKSVEEIMQDEVWPNQRLKLHHFQLMSNRKFVFKSKSQFLSRYLMLRFFFNLFFFVVFDFGQQMIKKSLSHRTFKSILK